METQRICPSCQKPLPPDVPLGLCPECLIKSGFNTGTEPGNPGRESGFVPPPVEELRKLFPQLEILELIGKGGMGAVYKARQPALDRLVALKVLPPGAVDDAGFAERFNREARALARLNHPHIVAVHDFGQVNRQPYLVMEFVDGPNLRQVEQAGRLTPEQALEIIPQICEALQFAHNEGVVHRDIKPENILLDKKGRVKITDFGIAKIVGVPAGKTVLTGAKDLLGTPHYMAPEQVEKPSAVDHRADIYSLGVVFYELLTGELPLGKFQPPSKKVEVDVRLDEVVLHALEKEPEHRYQHASQVKTDVETIAHTPASGAAEHRASPALQSQHHTTTLSWVGLTLGMMLVMLLPFVWPPFGPLFVVLMLVGLVIGALVLAGLWPFRRSSLAGNSWRSLFEAGHSEPPTAAGATEEVRRQVRGPAIGLLVTGILNWIAIPLILFVTAGVLAGKGYLVSPPLLLVPLSVLILSSVMIVAGLKMKRLEAYPLAIIGSILAMLVTPGNLIGLPVGIWSLVVLCRREVREAFGKGYWPPRDMPAVVAPAARPPDRFWRRFAVAVVLGLLALMLIPVGTILLGIALPALSRAKYRPNVTLSGTVSDAATGQPIPGARVDDTRYGPNRVPQQAWTDASGRYELRTWYEEHTISASAPGYEPILQTLLTKPFGKEQRVQMDFKLVQSTLPSAAKPKAGANARRKFVRLVVDTTAMTFEGRPTTWDALGGLLAHVPERANTVLELAVTSDQITVAQQNHWLQKTIVLARQHGFEYASFIGIHPLGSTGSLDPSTQTGATTATTRAALFGPVIERMVAGEGDANQRFIDFDTGKLFAALDSFGPEEEPSPEETQAWWRKNGIDAMGDTRPAVRGLAGLEMVAVPVPNEEWDQLSPARLDYYFTLAKPGTPAALSGKGASPATFAIKTREGGAGLLQITGFSEQPPAMKIRYKLVEHTKTP